MITKIQSISDIITNSSSEVFVMEERNVEYYNNLDAGGCIRTFPITMNWLQSQDGRYEWEMICHVCDLDQTEVQGEYRNNGWWSYYEGPDEETWKAFLELHKDAIEKRIEDLYWVDIEDHFEDAKSVISSARNDALWMDSRH